MKISLVHPSRGRPDKSFNNAQTWLKEAGAPCELVVSLDHDDPKLSEYKSLYGGTVLVNPNRSVVDATNRAAVASRGDILLYLSDDFECYPDWGQDVIMEFQKYKGPTLIKVDDCLQPFGVAVLTIPIMNRALYERLGYFWHPAYKSMFVDEDLYWTCKNNGWLKKAPHLKFPHNHVSVGKADNDETYKRSAANWDQGKATFARRKAAGFPL
jgi:hypothetical protein